MPSIAPRPIFTCGIRMASGLIIVVDDDPSFRKLYSDFLTVTGYTVLTAKSGAEVMKFLLNCTPKVLILDISMPVMDGIETCKKIRRMHGNEIPIVFMTSFTDVDNLRQCMHAGGDDYMIKSDRLDCILERFRFWSAAPNRHEARLRRSEVVQEVDNAIIRIDQAANESNGNDRKVDNMSRLMATAQSLADKANLKGADNKLYVVGYAAGIVCHWADTQLGVKSRYMDYFRAALSGSYLLKRQDINQAVEHFDEISMEPVFLMARDRATIDCRETKVIEEDVMIMEGDSAYYTAVGRT